MIHNTTKEYLELISSAISNKTGVKIQAGKQWRANIQTKVLEYKQDHLMELPFYVSKGLLLHEMGHINYTEMTPTTSLEKQFPEAMHNLYNSVEDKRIEYLTNQNLREFSRSALSNMNGYFVNYNLVNHKDDFKYQPKLIQFAHLINMYQESKNNTLVSNLIGYRASNIFDNYFNSTGLNDLLDEEVTKRFRDNEVIIGDILDQSVTSQNHEIVKNIIDSRLYPIIKDYIENFESERKNQSQQSKDSPVSKVGNNQDQAQNIGKNIYKNLKASKNFEPIMRDVLTELEAKMVVGPYANTLSQKLREILESRKTVKFTGNHRTGKLLSKNVYKIANNESRIFSRKNNLDLPDRYNLYVAVDSSGSMAGGNNIYYAVLGSFLIKFVMDNLKLPCKYFVFSDQHETRSIKDPSDYKLYGGGTDDSKVYEMVKNDIKEENNGGDNIVFIITDGEIYNSDVRKRNMSQLEALNTQIIGIGIGDDIESDNLKINFKNYIHVTDVSGLPVQVANILRELIRN